MKHPPRDQDHENHDAYFQVNEDKSSRRALAGGDYSDQRDLEGNDFQMSEFSRSRMNSRSSFRSSLVAGSLINKQCFFSGGRGGR
jgi:hypothetical protein